MKYWLPSYSPVKDNKKIVLLNARFAAYRQGMNKAWRAALLIGAKTKQNRYMLEQLLFKTDAKIVKDIIKHIRLQFSILNIQSGTEHHRMQAHVVNDWFSESIMLAGEEYVMKNGVWYAREWAEYKSDPEHESAVVFYRKDTGQSGTLGTVVNSHDISKLRHGTALLKQTEAIHKGAGGVIKKTRKHIGESVGALSEFLGAIYNVNEQLRTKRHEIMIKLVREILDLSRFVVLAGPTTVNDSEFYARWGYGELRSLLELVAAQHCTGDDRVEIVDYDTRLLRPMYDQHQNPHSVIGFKLAQAIEGYANSRKTVNE